MAIDWQRLLLNLGRVESAHTTARRLGLDAVHLLRLRRGEVAEPRFSSGLRLLDYHLQRCPERHHIEDLCP